MHRGLVSYFSRKSSLSPDDLADETLTRVLRRVGEDGAIADMPAARYSNITARFVFPGAPKWKTRFNSAGALSGPSAAGFVPSPESGRNKDHEQFTKTFS